MTSIFLVGVESYVSNLQSKVQCPSVNLSHYTSMYMLEQVEVKLDGRLLAYLLTSNSRKEGIQNLFVRSVR